MVILSNVAVMQKTTIFSQRPVRQWFCNTHMVEILNKSITGGNGFSLDLLKRIANRGKVSAKRISHKLTRTVRILMRKNSDFSVLK